MIFVNFAILIIGFVALIKGADFFVDGSASLARKFGFPSVIIGLTIVAASKGETGLAVGNVVGSNIFNLMFILGISAMINPISINMASLFDLMILIAISLMAFSFCVSGEKIERREGIVMVAAYAADMLFAIVR